MAIVTADQAASKNVTPARQVLARPRSPVTWRVRLRLLLLSLILVQLLQAEWRQPPSAVNLRIDALTAAVRFNLAAWEVEALTGKVSELVTQPARGLSLEQEKAFVVDYLNTAQRVGQLEDEVERIFADASQTQPETATRNRRTELTLLRSQLIQQAPVVEAVLQHQIARQIDATGLTTLGLAWPPPRLRFTEPPQLLVVSPRDRIERLRSVDLLPDLDSSRRAQLESAVTQETGLSAYVTGIGGYGAYPTMVINRYGLSWTLETIAHEWVHNYLAFHALGWSFLRGGDAITINETVASIVGEELGRAVMEAYYPELLPPPPAPPSEVTEPSMPQEPPPFDFNREMQATRLEVDRLLALGRIERAEAFMEARRQEFVRNGYRLRVLNQAYFAFHGSYATRPAATDPIGPKLQQLRDLSPSLAAFLRTVDGMTSVTDIDAALARLRG